MHLSSGAGSGRVLIFSSLACETLVPFNSIISPHLHKQNSTVRSGKLKDDELVYNTGISQNAARFAYPQVQSLARNPIPQRDEQFLLPLSLLGSELYIETSYIGFRVRRLGFENRMGEAWYVPL